MDFVNKVQELIMMNQFRTVPQTLAEMKQSLLTLYPEQQEMIAQAVETVKAQLVNS